MKTQHILSLILIALVASACAGMSAAEVTTASVTGVGALVAFVEALRPMLEPEQAAQLTALATNVEGTVEAVATALGQVAETVGRLKADADAGWTDGEVAGGVGVVGATGIAVSRVLSHLKHKPKA